MEKQTLVMKFGESSVSSVDALVRVTQIIQDAKKDWERIIVVTSAMSNVTELLLDSTLLATQGKVNSLSSVESKLREVHFSAINVLIDKEKLREEAKAVINTFIQRHIDLCKAVAVIGEASPRTLDLVASLGERMSLYLLMALAQNAGINTKVVDAADIIVTNSVLQSERLDFKATTQRTRAVLNPIMDQGIVPITTGFIGAMREGVDITSRRSGSDYSAVIIGAVLPADDIWIWTDLDGVMTTDPRIVTGAITLPEISHSEVAEMTHYGANILHPKAIRPVVEMGVGLRICNTFNPSHPGTRLITNSKSYVKSINGQVIKAVAAIRRQRLVTIEGRGMVGIPDVVARAFSTLASTGTNVLLITQASSEQSICFVIPSETASSIVSALEETFFREIEDNDIGRIWATEDVSIITVIGTGIRHTPGVAGKVFSQLAKNGVNILAIAQGSSEVSINIVVNAADTKNAVNALHELIG